LVAADGSYFPSWWQQQTAATVVGGEAGAMAVLSPSMAVASSSIEAGRDGFQLRLRVDRAVEDQELEF
jgi:hypothetical protein